MKVASEATAVEKTCNSHSYTCNLQSIRDDIRKRIIKWQRTQKLNKLQQLKEHKDYTVSIMQNTSKSKHPTITILCGICKKQYRLNQKGDDGDIMLSNWTNHVKKCALKPAAKEQPSILEFVPVPQSDNSEVLDIVPTALDIMSPGSNSTIDVTSSDIDSDIRASSLDEEHRSGSASLDHSSGVEACKCTSGCEKNSCVDDTGEVVIDDSPEKIFVDWSYATCKVKKYLKYNPNQTVITEWFPIVDKINALIQANQHVSALVKNNQAYSTTLFQKLLLNAQKNCELLPKQRRHAEVMKKFAISILLVAGPCAYKLLHANMPEALPSLNTVQRQIKKSYSPIVEGEFRFDQLSSHLEAYNAPRIVCISEDATRTVARVEYDDESDKMVGFVLPVDDKFLFVTDTYCAYTFEGIEKMFGTATRSCYAYLYMAQPLASHVPPFCLCLFGTNNKFDTKAVLYRWKYIIEECSRRNIHVLCFSSDGDSRLLNAMRISSQLYCYSLSIFSNVIATCTPSFPSITIPASWSAWFTMDRFPSITVVQDTVHLAVKLKARLLTHSQILPLGKFSAQSSHLGLVQASFSKAQHNLRVKDLDHQDRQNFDSAVRISSPNVLALLDELVDAKGTKYYLLIIKSVIDSYLSKELDPLSRIEAWFAVFFVRYWRKWLTTCTHGQYTLTNNFITLNAHVCIELNAHALVTLARMGGGYST